ncbi:hypothetical protein OG259_24070 [Streptomyces sp. NBC_00250]|uniref:hypothetical protein n=1 Tax=Streptomyces sp. NBC_00250 TaxID=2903641 RepID=UPI002E2978B2|nr:hypothetical protein [Streptomyces sp. NBC_00250]
MVRTRLKLAATLTVVVLALTGFHTGHGSSSGGGSGKSKSGKSRGHSDDDSGGGCSSDEKSNDDYSGSGGSTVTASPSPTSVASKVDVVVVDCVKSAQKKRKGKPARKADTTATLKIVSRDASPGTFRVVLRFEGATGRQVDLGEASVAVAGYETKTFEVAMENPHFVDRVKNCRIDEVRVQETSASGSPSPAP